MKLPVSLLASYLYCPRKVFLQKVLKLREPIKKPLVLGTIRHKVLELASIGEKDVVCSIMQGDLWQDVLLKYTSHYEALLRETISHHETSLEKIGMGVLDAYGHSLPSLLNEAAMRAANTFEFFEETNLEGEELWKNLTPKILSEVRLESNELGLVGVIDQIHDYGEYAIPVELKTGKAPKMGVWEGHRIQASAYALMLEENRKIEVRETIVHYLDFNEKRKVVLNPFMKEELILLIGEVKELISNTILPEFCESKQKCVSCGLKSQCYDEQVMKSLLALVRRSREVQSQLV
jgi:CRISPR-associated protein Cas4